ncbi:phosphatase 2C-like domain-containing protein [Dunaliella salina]|uniref:Phosphatase 2C-like domain-containing protein n=1 Tax=Dunaliella salina TaxID=3046 RepID=A0ABQ7H8S9_DUNSA|nr:phosphatase 2C-like domain-containing protein [Dunaliella salina]|eukprot:KAF5843263.1 phosphatase 2C-like domain-containing protein [Dunaliella salina]
MDNLFRRHSHTPGSNVGDNSDEGKKHGQPKFARSSLPESSAETLHSLTQSRSHTRRPDIGQASLAGNRYGCTNQDYCVIQELYASGEIPLGGRQCYIISIQDGHGILGDKSAVHAGKALARHIFSGLLRNKHLVRMEQQDVFNELEAAFRKANKAANSVYDHPPRTVNYVSPGGKMATYELTTHEDGMQVYREQGKRVEKMLESVLGYKDELQQFRGETVTVRHNGKNITEAARIRSDHADMTRLLEDGYIQAAAGPWAGYELSVTRALGHKNMEAYGVVAKPHVSMLKLEQKHTCLVLASDGVWDVMQPDEALVQHAVQLGLSTQQHQDNTSAIVVFF